MRAFNRWLALAPLLFIAGCRSFHQAPPPTHSGSALSLADANLGEALAHYSQALISETILGEGQSARVHLRQAAELDPSNLAVHLKVAMDFIGQKDFDGALSILKPLASADPPSYEVLLLLGSVYEAQGNPGEAARIFQAAICVARDRPEGYIRLATLHVMGGSFRKALGSVEFGLRYAKDLNPLLKFSESVGRMAMAENDLVNAIPFFELILSFKPEADAIRESLAHCYGGMGEARKALAHVKVLLQKHPDNTHLAFQLGDLHELMGDNEKALEAFSQAGKGASAEPLAVLRQANLEEQSGRGRGIKTLQAALSRFPEDVRLRVFLALLCVRLERYPEALTQFDEVARLVGKDISLLKQLQPLFYFWYGSACERAGRLDEGERYIMKYLAANPDAAEALNYLAYMWAEQGRNLEQAENYILKALKNEPDNGAYLDTLGWIQFKKGDPATALNTLGKALKEEGDDPAILDHMGDVCSALHKTRQAVGWWRRSLKKEPDNKAVRGKLIKAGVDARDLPAPAGKPGAGHTHGTPPGQ
ncbi:MAG: tetratricopeptide repeat protein [bacterium]